MNSGDGCARLRVGSQPGAFIWELALLAFLGFGTPVPAPAQVTTSAPLPADTVPPGPVPPDTMVRHEAEPCSVVELNRDDRADLLRSKAYRTACGSALWFDAFFRDDRLISETATTHGWVQLGASYRSVEQFEPYTKARVKVVLPAAGSRLNLFLGKDDPDAILMDTDDHTSGEDRVYDPDEEDEWLAGFGYAPVNDRMNNLSFGAGVSLNWPPDPYVRGQYRYNWEVTDIFLIRLRQTLFWKNSEGVGSTSRIDLERSVGGHILVRWHNRGTVSRYRYGLDWASGITVFQNVGGPQALAYKVFAEGLTGLPYNVANYGLTVIYRRRTAREWLWVEFLTGVSRPRFSPEEERRTNPGFGIILEVRFP